MDSALLLTGRSCGWCAGYSQAVEQHDGSILIVAGQMAGHWNAGRLDPLWLLEEEQAASFTSSTALAGTDDFSGDYVTSCSYQACGGYMGCGRQVYCDTCFSKTCPKWNTSNPACLEQEGHDVLPVSRMITAGICSAPAFQSTPWW